VSAVIGSKVQRLKNISDESEVKKIVRGEQYSSA
jgi:hypothetical protein